MEQERAEYNRKILRLLSKYLKENPSFKFVQALHVMSIINNLSGNQHEDSEVTYNRVIKTLEMQKQMKEKIYGNGVKIPKI